MRPRNIVFTIFGSLGDLHPFLAIAMELRSRGHNPIVAATVAHREVVEAAGVEFAVIGPDQERFKEDEASFNTISRTTPCARNGSASR